MATLMLVGLTKSGDNQRYSTRTISDVVPARDRVTNERAEAFVDDADQRLLNMYSGLKSSGSVKLEAIFCWCRSRQFLEFLDVAIESRDAVR